MVGSTYSSFVLTTLQSRITLYTFSFNVFFKDEFEAFDYIKLQVENDEKYSDYLKNPSEHIMDMYNSLDYFDKRMIEMGLVQRLKNKLMRQYFT